jgi:sphinganine C4-monooxygenase
MVVDDHCGWAFPWDPFQFLFSNNSVYHDVHHQTYGIKANFSQPFFTYCMSLLALLIAGDHIFGTYKPPPSRTKPAEEIVVQELTDGPVGAAEGSRKRRKSIHSPQLNGTPKITGITMNGSRSKMNGSANGIGSRRTLVEGK